MSFPDVSIHPIFPYSTRYSTATAEKFATYPKSYDVMR